MTESTSGKGSPSHVTMAFSGLTHVLLLAPVIYILVLAFAKYSFFSWHPICMSIGVGLLITEAVFSVSGEAYIGSKISRSNRVTMHWILHTAGLLLVLIGLIIIVTNKINGNRAHFATPHSILGLISIIMAVLTAAFGIVTNNPKWLYPRFRPVLLKIMHAFAGIAVTILLLASIITGTYTGWWSGGETGRSLVFASLFIAGFFILLKPILGAVSRSKVIFGPPPTTT
ncbi:PREDICTED: cytochrome b561 domain-containing protein 2-like [Dufourea novaeangliae]|uniref:ascorbate ferrireductase (transmembrane) n=1 Tax=Dufourea novaeangliae TaxID=178035 RepID=A0A154PE93_DUFNO|nr:PREDICTED: cytochrome b561 domain-containing protein 2-like [Dufourea novaeangliae]KZC10147.1 Cytochrome b561 domain-containing protein 2 [Dufourea novaeangliae]